MTQDTLKKANRIQGQINEYQKQLEELTDELKRL